MSTAPGEFGLDPAVVRALREFFGARPGVERVWIYGSRARGEEHTRSDVDLVVDAPDLDRYQFAALERTLSELMLVRKVELVHWQGIDDDRFRSQIERDRKVFWVPRSRSTQAAEPGAVELKEFQSGALACLAEYVEELARQREKAARVETLKAAEPDIEVPDFARKAWEALAALGKLPPASAARGYSDRMDGAKRPIPNVCLKIPTGGGKTLLAAAAIARLHARYYRRHHGMVLWIVPNEAIYRQTKKALADRDHPYRQMLNVAGAGRVKLLEKDAPLSRVDVESHLCVMLLMLQSAARQSKETLRFFRDRGNVHGFFPREDDLDGHWRLLGEIPNLSAYAPDGSLEERAARNKGSVIKDSLGNVMRLLRPMVVIDEGHHSYTDTALKTIDGFNPSFVLELSATPRVAKRPGEHGANILVDIHGTDLERAEMIKLPINVDVRPWPDWQSCLAASFGKLEELEREARTLEADTARYIRPILLVQAERTGADQVESGLIHSEHAHAFLLQLGLQNRQIAIKTSEKDELAQPENQDLLSPANEVRAIITKQALQEGWDCPFAYVLCALAAGRNPGALTQLLGRILRQPQVAKTGRPILDECYVYCHDAQTADVVKSIKNSLEAEGMGDLVTSVRSGPDGNGGSKRTPIGRRNAFKGVRIFLPRVAWVEGASRRELAYESDVLGAVDWNAITADSLARDWAPSRERAEEQQLKIGLDILSSDDAPRVQAAGAGPAQLDRVFLTRAIGDLVPNAWRGYALIEAVVARLIEAGHDEARIAASSALLVEQLRTELEAQRDALAESVFAEQVRAGQIEFRLRADRLDYEIPEELAVDLPERPRTLARRDGHAVERSLFDPVFDSMLDNEFEGEFACYLDAQSALTWWHRNVARSGYGLQGWRRNKVYPDFVFAKTERDGKPALVVLETKGLFLKNEDTEYKQKLLAALTGAYAEQRMARKGDLELIGEDGRRVICDLVFDENWKNTLNERYFRA
jgi:type III restriction enzyme